MKSLMAAISGPDCGMRGRHRKCRPTMDFCRWWCERKVQSYTRVHKGSFSVL